jgi:hypothetical protein
MTTFRAFRPRSRRTVLAALVLVPALGLAACGGDSGTAAEDDLRNPTNSPLAKLLGFDTSPAEQRAKDLEMQDVIAECMRGEGWEYTPVDWNAQNSFSDEWEEQMEDPLAYGEKYGYGVVRQYELGNDVPDTGGMEDPNWDYVQTLSEDESEQYYASLYGQSPEITDPEEFVPPPLEEQGCQGKAQLEVFGDSPWNNPDISAALEEMYQDMADDPRIADANEAWAACMAEIDESYEWANPDEIWGYLYERLNELQGIDNGTFEDVSADGGVTSDTIAIPIDGGPQQPQEIDPADLEDLRSEELAIYADDQSCQDTADLLQIRRDVEQDLADDLLAQFPELGDDEG